MGYLWLKSLLLGEIALSLFAGFQETHMKTYYDNLDTFCI